MHEGAGPAPGGLCMCGCDTCKSDAPNLGKSFYVDLEKERVRCS